MDQVLWRRTVEPSQEPITLEQARKQVEVGSDTSHDDHLTRCIETARSLVEHDTGLALMTQTIEQYFDGFDDLRLTRRPIQSVSSIVYYDSANTLQTLSTSIYSVNHIGQCIELAYDQVWPAIVDRWDAIKVTYIAGFTSAAYVPAELKQAMLLQVGCAFEERDMLTKVDRDAYDNLVARHMRPSYP